MGVCSGNDLGASATGAEALAPSLAKLTQLQTLNLGGEWSVCVWRTVCTSPCAGLVCVPCRVSAVTYAVVRGCDVAVWLPA